MDKTQDSFIFEDKTWEKGFTQIPNIVLTDSSLSTSARLLYTLLLKHAWGSKDMVYPGQAKLAKEVGCSERHIKRLLNELKKANLVTWKRRGFNKTNIYTLKKISSTRLDRTSMSSHDRTSMSPQLGHPVPTKKTKKKKTKNNNTKRERKLSHSEITSILEENLKRKLTLKESSLIKDVPLVGEMAVGMKKPPFEVTEVLASQFGVTSSQILKSLGKYSVYFEGKEKKDPMLWLLNERWN